MNRVFVAGGTGFLGYHCLLEFLKRGCAEAATISLPDIRLGDWFPGNVRVTYGDLFKMSVEEIACLFDGFDALIYSIGPDDRVTPEAPAYEFFRSRLVEAVARVVAGARKAGVRKCVVMNSYFAYFDRMHPEWRLSERHPYIRCRVEQAEKVIAEGKDGEMDVMILELPYIFGSMPERVPLWKEVLVDMLVSAKIVFYPGGGSAMISVEHVAEAAAGAVENGRHGAKYPVGDLNMTWNEMLSVMLKYLGMPDKKVVNIPKPLAVLAGRRMAAANAKAGKESGLDLRYIMQDIMCRRFYLDDSSAKRAQQELGYGTGGLEEAIARTVRACVVN